MIYAFDSFTLDTGQYELRRGQEHVAVEPQVFELLALLVAASDRLVTRDEIVERVWNGRIVSEAAVSSRIKAARRAIGDDGSAQRLIRTVQRRGFRFIGTVREVAPAAVEAPASEVGLTPPAAISPAHAARTEALAAELMARPAIAVLPFADATDGAGASYMADGVTDEVIAALSAWRCFPVISRNTAFRYRGTTHTAPEIGRLTGARYLLTGTLQRSVAQVKLTAALVDAADDRQLWSGRFVRPLDEIFLLEEELAGEVVATLEPEIRNAEVQRVLRKAPGDLTAWDLAMRAAWHANHSSIADYDAAEALAGEAAVRVPGWSFPMALIAFVKFQRAMRGWSKAEARTAFAETLAAARAALRIDGSSWMAHALAGVGELWTNLHYARALDHVHRAIQLNPSACWGYHFCGCISGFSGDLQAAVSHQSRVFTVDPAYPYTAVIEADLAMWRMLDGDLDAALRHATRCLEWDPAYGRGLQRLVALHGLRGDRGAAGHGLARLAELEMPIDRDSLIASYPFRDPAHRATFFRGLRQAGVNL